LHSGANPLSKVRFTRHIPVARPLGRAGTRCKNAPGIFVRVRAPSLKNPPLAGFCILERTRYRRFDRLPPFPNIPNFASPAPIPLLNPVATQTDFMAKPICRFASVLRCQTGTA
jgi:hypothetical protein